MSRKSLAILFAGVSLLSIAVASTATARDLAPMSEPRVLYANDAPALAQGAAPVRMAAAQRSGMGGGFIEFLFSGEQEPRYERQRPYYQQAPEQQLMPQAQPRDEAMAPAQQGIDPKFERQVVDYDGTERPGTIVIDTPRKFLYLVQEGGKALRYGVGVGKPGFTWSGVKTVTNKREWPDWTPPPEMLKRRPDLPRHMEGGPQNPLGARAMYLGSSLYRIHGSNEPWTIGTNVSSGCIRMRNEDVTDLYERVKVGTRVIVM